VFLADREHLNECGKSNENNKMAWKEEDATKILYSDDETK
jgi:hypothetical protein